MPKTTQREYRMIQETISPILQNDLTSDYIVEGYAAVFDIPYKLYEYDGIEYYEVVDRNALDGADLSDVIMQYDHTGNVRARTRNKTLDLGPDDKGIKVWANLETTSKAKELYEEIKAGLVDKMSWAFTVAEDSYNSETRTRRILKVKKVYDVSAVSIPANDDTEINARNYFNGVIEMEKQELLEQKKKQLKKEILKIKLEA